MTAQFHENLILDGEDTSMAYCPPLPPEGDDQVRMTGSVQLAGEAM